MTPTAAVAHIRRLACLGVGADVAMPDILDTIRHVVPSANNAFVSTDESYVCKGLVQQHWTPDLLQNLGAKRATEYREICDQHEGWWRHAPANATFDDEGAAYRGVYRTPMYTECWRPFGQHHLLEALLRAGGRPAGYLHVFRDHHARRFTLRERRRFAALVPYIALVLNDTAASDLAYAEPSQRAVLVIDAIARISHRSEGAHKLLMLAFNPDLALHADIERPTHALVKQLLHKLRAADSGDDAGSPCLERRNCQGHFFFRAQWMQANADEDRGACVIIERAEPLALRLMRGLAKLPLSPGQKSLALLLAQGQSREAVAARLGIAAQTVKDYVGIVYAKLGVHDRYQLTARLLESSRPERD